PKLMRAHRRRLDPGALERMANERSNAGRAQKPAARRAAAQKDATTGTPGSAVAEIGRNGCADISGQGKRSSVTALASDAHLSRVPVDIAQPESSYFARPQPEAGEQEHDRVVTPADGGMPIDAGQQLTNLIDPYRSRDRSHRPVRHDGHRSR